MKGVVQLPALGPPAGRLPFVLVNMAMTADGKIATANRHVSSFGSRQDLAHLYALRATADAVMCGARTVSEGGATLDTGGTRYVRRRLALGLKPHPLRLVVSGSGSLDPALPVFRARSGDRRDTSGHGPLAVLTTARADSEQRRRLAAAADVVLVCHGQEVDWPVALAHLRRHWGVRRLLCEGGGELNDALFRADLVQELHLTICPFLFGGRAAPTIAEGLGVPRLEAATSLRLRRRRRVGDELFCVFQKAGMRGHFPP